MDISGFQDINNMSDSDLFQLLGDPDVERRFFMRQEIAKRRMALDEVCDCELYKFAEGIGLDKDEIYSLGIVNKIDNKNNSKVLSIVSKDEEQRTVLGIVLEPDVVDAQSETISAIEIEDSAHGWLANSQHVGFMHTELIDKEIEIYESYVAPVDFEINDFKIKKGTWLVMAHVVNDKLWGAVKDGQINGFSVGGYGHREKV